MTTETAPLQSVNASSATDKKLPSALQVVTWFGVGVAVAAVGVLVGREVRNRYKFKHRTPYDFYSASGEYASGDYGVGI